MQNNSDLLNHLKTEKKEMTNIDISVAVKELQSLINAKFDKAFLVNNQDGRELILKVHNTEMGTQEIIIGIGKYKYITKTEYDRQKPKNPHSFVMLLRKNLRNIKITKIEQHNFDRIVKITFEWNELKYMLIIELFKDGNVILLDSDNKIIMPLRTERFSDRKLIPKEEYRFPTQRDLEPANLEYEVTKKIFKEELKKEEFIDLEIVRIISRLFGLAGVYAEEICKIANMDKNLKNPNGEQSEQLYSGIKEFFKLLTTTKPYTIIAEEKTKEEQNNQNNQKEEQQSIAKKIIDVSPIELIRYEESNLPNLIKLKVENNIKVYKKYYTSYLTALDEYFSQFILQKDIKKEETKLDKLIKKQERIVNSQIETKAKYEKQSAKNHEKGDLIYANFTEIDEIINTIRSAREKMEWKQIKKIISENKDNPILGKVESINEKNAELNLKLIAEYGGDLGTLKGNVAIDIRKSAFENADDYYTKAKKFKYKVAGVITALEISQKKLAKVKQQTELDAELLKQKQQNIKKKERRVLKWYEKLKWTIIDNYLVIAGKDATTNEIIVKKYLEKNDIVFHTLMEGAPFTVIKNTSEETPSEETLLEVAKFAVSHSKAWKLGLGSADVYWVTPEQISKTAESGEFLKKGAFVIRGKRNFIRSAPLDLGVGILEYDGEKRVTTAPSKTIENSFEKYELIKPGKLKKSNLVKQLLNEFKDYELIDEDIFSILPPGESEYLNSKDRRLPRRK
ncbi:putative ribosome quality control (RQC) complex YloA/Tae2 family protein [Methanococcus voltae PS]|uniref:Archaeal Rqc2 homolog aRqcH n=1 Tax=Methanococcus voltae PS TaxID=523842 RepID=A0ABT2EUR3_METVO|nr:ribosome rescue protein RqcH [Methanococcus voltae]MCS3921698.1 putative ribosome quality control (RQC) complex YloA/Tae2 family protein [Methanococcus voltae PS]